MGTVYENILSGHESIFSFTALESHGIREFRLPSVNFKYEFDPISVLHYRASRSLTSFAVSLCAIIGGALALIKYLHAIWIRWNIILYYFFYFNIILIYIWYLINLQSFLIFHKLSLFEILNILSKSLINKILGTCSQKQKVKWVSL